MTILGSRQFFKYESKKALSFVNFVHYLSDMEETFNLFLTLSFPDLHEPALHRLLPGRRLGAPPPRAGRLLPRRPRAPWAPLR